MVNVALRDHRPPEFWLALGAASVLVHYGLFHFWPTTDKRSAPARSRVSSNLHAALCLGAWTFWVLNYTTDPHDPERMLKGKAGTPDEFFPYMITISSGYFIADLLIMLRHHDVYDWGSLLHHFLIMPSFVAGVAYNVCLPYQFFYLIEELSTPFLNIKYLYRDNKTIHNITSVLFALTFLFGRFVIGTYVSYSLYLTTTAIGVNIYDSLGERIVFLVMFCLASTTRFLNLYWAFLIVGKLFSTAKPKEKKEH